MKKLIIYLLSLIIFPSLPASAIKKPVANPINLAVLLVEMTDSTRVAATLDYYGYALQGEKDGFKILRHPNGNELRYTYAETPGQQFPTIIAKPTGSQKQTDAALTELKFNKIGKNYQRKISRYHGHLTNCTHGPHSTLIFRRH